MKKENSDLSQELEESSSALIPYQGLRNACDPARVAGFLRSIRSEFIMELISY